MLLRTVLLLSALTVVGFTAPAATAASKVYGNTLAPIGFVQFCAREPSDVNCSATTTSVAPIHLTAAMWNKIRQVNQYVNTTIRPTTDQELYGQPEFWTYPTAAAGDCEDYALLKQRYLIGLDIPVQDLLLTVLKDEKGDGHALLTVVTDQGEFALDMRRSEILLATNAETGYTFLKRQSQTNQHQWVTLVAPHGVDTTVSTK